MYCEASEEYIHNGVKTVQGFGADGPGRDVAIPPHACVMFAVNATQARIGTSSFVFDARRVSRRSRVRVFARTGG